MQSLKGKLSAGLLISLLVILVLQTLFVSVSIRRLIEDYVNSRLVQDSENVLSALYIDTDGSFKLKPDRVGAVYNRPFSGRYFRISFDSGRVLRSRSLWDEDIEISNVKPGESFEKRTVGPQEQQILTLSSGYVKHGRTLSITVAEDVSHLESDIKWFQKVYIMVSIVIMVTLVITQWLIVRAALAPLSRAQKDLSRLEKGEIKSIESDLPSEVRPLVDEINGMLTVMNQRLKRSRKAMGNLAHALKTPLTTISRISEDDEINNSELQSVLKKNTEAINNLIDRELTRAMVAGPVSLGQSFIAEKDISDLITTLERIYREKNLSIEWSLKPSNFSIYADKEDIVELLGVLLDNACKWSRSRVVFTATCGQDVTFVVEDDGPGCDQDKLQTLKKRGVRLDESGNSHGLGLSIADDIVESYSGLLEFDRSESLGGFLVRVRLVDAGKSRAGASIQTAGDGKGRNAN